MEIRIEFPKDWAKQHYRLYKDPLLQVCYSSGFLYENVEAKRTYQQIYNQIVAYDV